LRPERSLDQDCHKPHQDPFIVVACFNQAFRRESEFGIQKVLRLLVRRGVIRLWMWPLLLNSTDDPWHKYYEVPAYVTALNHRPPTTLRSAQSPSNSRSNFSHGKFLSEKMQLFQLDDIFCMQHAK
jgi:hypothetical protein